MHLLKHWLREASSSKAPLLQTSKDFKPKHQGFLPRRDASSTWGLQEEEEDLSSRAQRALQRLCMCIVVIEKKERGETRGACNISRWVWNPSKALMTATERPSSPK